MKIGIITAMKEEADHIIKEYDLKESISLQNIHIYENNDIVLVLAWIWKIQASIGATYLCTHYKLKSLINIWIAGSLLGENARIWDVFILGEIHQHDMYLPFDGSHLDYCKKSIMIPNTITYINKDWHNFWIQINSIWVTWDQFIDDQSIVNKLYDTYKADIVEMEAFAIASVAREFNLLDRCIFIKAISDGANNESIDAHMWNLDFAMKNSIVILDKIISNLK